MKKISLSIVGASFLCSFQIVMGADYGKMAIVGDSITQGGNGYASYRYNLWKHLVDAGDNYQFAGSQVGALANSAGTTAAYAGQTFQNVHEGHFGWRAYWENDRVAIPTVRLGPTTGNNLGYGTILNWTGQKATYATSAGTQTYSGTTYTPDTVVITIGSNDLSEGSSTTYKNDQLLADVRLMVQQYQAANPNARIYLASVPQVGAGHASSSWLNSSISSYNQMLATQASAMSTGSSQVSYADTTKGFVANSMTYDNVHPNLLGERVIATNLARAMGIEQRDAGLTRASGTSPSFSYVQNMDSVPTAQLTNSSLWTQSSTGVVNLTKNVGASASMLQQSWSAAGQAAFSADVVLQMVSNGQTNNNFVIWLDDGAGGADAGFLRIYDNRTVWGFGTTTLLDMNANTDGFHSFRVVYVQGQGYMVWRDDELIGENLGASGISVSQNLAVFGMHTGSETTNANIDSLSTTVGSAFAPNAVPEPSVVVLGGLGALCLLRRKRA